MKALTATLIGVFALSSVLWAQMTFTPPGSSEKFTGQRFSMEQTSGAKQMQATGDALIGYNKTQNQWAVDVMAKNLKPNAKYQLALVTGNQVKALGSPAAANSQGALRINTMTKEDLSKYNKVALYELPSGVQKAGPGAKEVLSLSAGKVSGEMPTVAGAGRGPGTMVSFSPPGSTLTFQGRQFKMLQTSIAKKNNVTGTAQVGYNSSSNQWGVSVMASGAQPNTSYVLGLVGPQKVAILGKPVKSDSKGDVKIGWSGRVALKDYTDLALYKVSKPGETPRHGAARLLSIPIRDIEGTVGPAAGHMSGPGAGAGPSKEAGKGAAPSGAQPTKK